MNIRPAFSSNGAIVGFTVLVVFFLILPIALGYAGYPKKEHIYTTVPTRMGPFSFFHKVIFEEKGDIDVLILGASLSWAGVDATIIKEALSKQLGREAVVYNFGSNWRGENLYYTLLRDLTEHRRVKLLLYNPPMPYQKINEPHQKSQFWTIYGDDDAHRDLSLYRRAQVYAFEMIGAPRNLVSLLRKDLTSDSEDMGSLLGTRKVYASRSGLFIKKDMQPPTFTDEQLLYGKATAVNYQFTGDALLDFQAVYNHKLFDLARSQAISIATIHLPLYRYRHEKTIGERANWAEVMNNPNIAMIGVPNSVLFAGLNEADLDNFYYDDHMNVNGAAFYTKAILPGILALYAKVQHPGAGR